MVINIHREGLLLAPTMNSLIAARTEAEAGGHRVEFIAVADKIDAETSRVLKEFHPVFDQVHHVTFGDLGASRAFGIKNASADWVFMHDADDLFSSNWYRVFLDLLAKGQVDQNTVYHTDIFARFGVEIDARKMIDSADPRFHPLMQASEWYFSNKAVFHRSLLDRFPMPKNDIRKGIGNEDWTWASHTTAAGIRHSPLPRTICFYRTKAAALSLGLTPGMIHDRSDLYAPDSIIKLAVQRTVKGSKIPGFAPHLVGRADPVIGEGPLQDWFWDEVQQQGAFESQITEFNARRTQIRCFLPRLHYNVVSAVEYLMKDMDTRPKIFIFASAENIRGADNVIDLFLRAAARYKSETYQPVLVLDEGQLVPSELRILASFGAKLISVEHFRRYYKIEDWYFSRLMLRPLVQYKGSIIVNLCSDTFTQLFTEFHRVLIENFKPLVHICLDPVFDLLSPSLSNILTNAIHHSLHTKLAMPVFGYPAQVGRLLCNARLHPSDLPAQTIAALQAVTVERYRAPDKAAPELDLSEILNPVENSDELPLDGATMPHVKYEEVMHQGRKFHLYYSAHAWVGENWLPTAAAFLFKNPHLSICAPQITFSRRPTGRAQARWHNYSNAASNFVATYEQVAGGHMVPVIALLREPLTDAVLNTPQDLALALAKFCTSDPKRLASAYGESVALYCPPELTRGISDAVPAISDGEIYWQCYEDLINIFARGYWTVAQIETHFSEHGIAEGRKIPNAAARDRCWSDSLYFATQSDGYKWWWEKGVLQTGAWRAANEQGEILALGAIPENTGFQARTALSSGALRQVAEFDSQHLAAAYLPELRHDRLEWAEHKQTGLFALLEQAEALKLRGVTDVIAVPALESGGAELVALWHYRAAQAAGRKPVMILTDNAVVTPRFAAENLTLLNIPNIVSQAVGDAFDKIPLGQRINYLVAAIESLAPKTTHIIHAFAAYQALIGAETAARICTASGRIYVSAFCPHIHPDGRQDGYFRDIPAIAQHVDQFIFDNVWFADQMRQTFQVNESQITTIAYPIDAIAPVQRDESAQRNVLWASRLDAQKNPQIIANIASALPDVTFHVYGRAVMGDQALDWSAMPDNVLSRGEFFGIDSLPIAQMDAFLYTSRFDGMPNILLEIAARGLPITAAPIGGIPEFLGPDWPLYAQTPDDVAGFCAALRKLLDDREFSQDIVARQLEFLREHRSLAKFLGASAGLYV